VQNIACVPMPDRFSVNACAPTFDPALRTRFTLPELAAFLMNEEIAKHKLPERLEIVEDFPLSPLGKVSKKDLTERITLKLKEEGKI